MASEMEGAAVEPPATRAYVQFTARLARAICQRVAAGEHLTVICADAGMPNRGSVTRWARDNPRFAKIYHRAKALAARTDGLGPTTTYCEVVAHEICGRIAEGESLTAICEDPAMPAMWTVMHWQRRSAAFAEALALARQAQAERMADAGWRLAMDATPETAILTSVRLAQLRWSAAIKSPRTHGRLRPAPPPEPPPKVTHFLFKHFHLETHPENGQLRMVTYTPDPDTRQPVRTDEGPWTDPVDPVAKMAEIERLDAERRARGAPPALTNKPHDPEGWL